MKEKILQQLKQANAQLGLGATVLSGISDLIANNVKTEEDIPQAVSGVSDILKAIQSDTDKERTRAYRLEQELKELRAEVEKNKSDDSDNVEEDKQKSAIAKQIDELSEKIEALQSERKAGAVRTQLQGKLREKKVPEEYYKLLLDAKDLGAIEDIEAEASTIASGYEALVQVQASSGFEGTKPPHQGDGGADTSLEQLAKQIADGTKQIVEQQK